MAEKITIDKIEEGAVLAESIINNFGQTILGAGSILKKKHKIMLKTWNIETVTIRTDEKDDYVEITQNIKELALEKFSTRFTWSPSNSFEQELFDMGIKNLIQELSKQTKEKKH